MKIRNRHDGTTVESQSLREEDGAYCLQVIERRYLFDVIFFSKCDGWEEVKETSNEELIDLACLWLQKHQSEYIRKRMNGDLYVCGACLTELRYYLNEMIKSD